MRFLTLSEKTIKAVLLQCTAISLILVVVLLSIARANIPSTDYAQFIFWAFTPALDADLLITSIVISLGFAGAYKYHRCWQGSVSFFLLITLSLSFAAIYLCKDIPNQIQTLFPTLENNQVYLTEIEAIKEELNCTVWNGNSTMVGCITKMSDGIGNYSSKYLPYTISAGCITALLLLIDVAFLFCVEPSKIDDHDTKTAETIQ